MPRSRAHLTTVVACGALVAAACAPAVRSDRDDSIPVPQGATWAWETQGGPREIQRPLAPDTTGAPERERPRGMMGPRYGMGGYGRNIPFDDVMFSQRFRRAAEITMQAKGFHKVDDPSQAEFLLSFDVGAAPMRRGGMAAVGVGVGFGRPWGWYRPWSYYRPWGWFVPWGWGFGWYDAWGWYGPPATAYQGYGAYPPYAGSPRDVRLVVMFRQRERGDVAWRASYIMDIYDLRESSQASVQKIADKVLRELR